MEGPPLKLTVQKGPAEGETIESKPRSKSIRIGRVIRGNTFSIKDPGISSKHLVIEFKDGEWLLSDLDTSNGTFLNGEQIKANTGVGLEDGDLIKIGELTSIEVGFSREREEEEEVEVEVKAKPRRGRLRKDEKAASVVVSVEKGKGVDLENGVGRPRRNLRRGVKAKEEQQQVLPPVKENVESLPEKRGRPRKGAKNSKNVQFVGVPEVDAVEEEEVAKPSQVEPLQEEILPPEKLKGDSVVVKRGRPVGRKGAKNSKSVCCEDLSVGVSAMNIVEEDEVMKSSQGEPSISGQNFVSEAPKVQKELDSKKETREFKNEASRKAENIASMKMTLDQLEKMTLGEWFDFMEVYLVKKIHDETDEIIAGMQARAEQFAKFMSEQESLKNKSPLF